MPSNSPIRETADNVPVRQMTRPTAEEAVSPSEEIRGEGPRTVQGMAQPAAIVSKTLSRIASGQNQTAASSQTNNAGETSGRAQRVSGDDAAIGLSEIMTSNIDAESLVSEVLVQFRAEAEIAVLAQANQLPNSPMPYSASSTN